MSGLVAKRACGIRESESTVFTIVKCNRNICNVPKMKGEEMFTVTKQLMKLRDEIDEAIQASKETYIEEIGDVLHASAVLVRVAKREGINVDTAIARVVEKNRRRGYYDEADNSENKGA